MPRTWDVNPNILGPINIGLGLGGGLAVGAATIAVGGSWLAIPTCALFGIAAGQYFAFDIPNDQHWQKALNILRKVRFMPRLARALFAAMLVGVVSIIEARTDALDLPEGFYIYMIPIFLSSVLLGRKAAVTALFLSLLAVAYFVIPPKFSFGFDTIWDMVCFGMFLVVALIMLSVIGTQADLSMVNKAKWPAQDAVVPGAPLDRDSQVETVSYLRNEAHRLTQIARSCSDVSLAQELEGISVELMEKAAELEIMFKVQPNPNVVSL